MPVLKPARREFFAQNIAKGMNQTQAHIAAGYKQGRNSTQNASIMAKLPEVIERVNELKERITSRAIDRIVLTKQYVIDGKIENAEKALGRRPVKISRRVKRDDDWEVLTDEVYVYEGAVANQALKTLGQELGMFTDRKEVKITNEYSNMTDEQLAQRLVEVGRQMLERPVIEHDPAERGGCAPIEQEKAEE